MLLETTHGTIAYDERGSGNSVVMLSSGAHDRHDFDALPGLLPDDFRSIAAARLAIRRPELVRGLVLIDSGGFLPRSPQVRIFCSLMARPRFLRAIYPWFANRYMRPQSEADLRVRDVGIATTRQDPGLAAVSGLWRSFSSPEHDLRKEAASIQAPTLIVWGKKDPVIPLRAGRTIAATIPGARLELLDTGHAPQVSDPDGFAALFVPFAERIFGAETSKRPA